MTKINLSPITGGYNLSQINSNFTQIATALNDKTLYRDNPVGEPNQMENDLDMNGKRIYNLPTPTSPHEAASLETVTTQTGAAVAAGVIAVDAAAQAEATLADLINFVGPYDVTVPYVAGIDMQYASQTVEYNGVVYAPRPSALPFTTSGVFETGSFRVIQGVTVGDLAASGGAALVGSTPVGSVAATTVQGAINELAEIKIDLAEDTGASLVGYLPTGTGAVATDVQTRLRAVDLKTVNVHDYVTGGLGTRASPWTGWDTGITWTSHTQYDFLDGVYGYATSPNFGLDFLRLNGKAATVLRHTGTGYAMLVDAGPLDTDFRVEVKINCRLESNASATGGVYCRGISRSYFDIIFNDVPGVQFRELGGVLNTLRLYQSAFVTGQSIIPISMLVVGQRTVAEPTSAGTYYLMGENCSGYGVVLEECLNGIFIGGTSEANDGGYSMSSSSNYNTFIGIDLEINTTTDLVCNGSFNTFINTISTKSASFAGKCNSIIGGAFNAITNTGDTNDFINVRYGVNGGTFTNMGTKTSKRNVYNLSTSLADPDTTNSQESVRSGGGSVGTNSGTPEEIFTANRTGRCEVVVYITSGDAANFTSSATVLTDGGGAARIIANNGTSLAITLSGLSVRVTQSSGDAQTVQYRYLWVA